MSMNEVLSQVHNVKNSASSSENLNYVSALSKVKKRVNDAKSAGDDPNPSDLLALEESTYFDQAAKILVENQGLSAFLGKDISAARSLSEVLKENAQKERNRLALNTLTGSTLINKANPIVGNSARVVFQA